MSRTPTAARPAGVAGLADRDRCSLLFRDPFSFTETMRCPNRATVEVEAGCVHSHVDIDKLCTEHALKAGNGTFCNECATTVNPVDRHACPIRLIGSRKIR